MATQNQVQKDQREKTKGMQQAAEQTAKGAVPQEPGDAPPNPPKGKAETRLFQTGPGEKVWLTQAEAEKRGFFWNQTANPKK